VRPIREPLHVPRGGRRLLVYSQDGFGLGHLRRSFTIAGELIAREPGSIGLVISDSPAPPFRPPAGVDYVKLPTVVKQESLRWRAASLALDIREILKLRARIMLEVLGQFRPDVVLVDHMPVGALGELKPLLDRAVLRSPRPILLLGLRDILDAPEVIRRAWKAVGAYEYLAYYDAILVYGSREVYDAGRLYDLRRHSRRLVYCNYASSRLAEGSIQRDEKLIVVTGGGGADAFPLQLAFLDALPILRKEIRVRALILAGPNMPHEDHVALVERAASRKARVLRSLDDATPWIQQATAVVSMAGYNSVCEALKTRTRAMVVPRRGPSAEQSIRARVFSERGLVTALEPDDLSADRLARDLLRLLSGDEPTAGAIPRMDGAERAAELISEVWQTDLGRESRVSRRTTARREPLSSGAGAD
jgi:predicted glycosyltransferase